MKCSIVIRCFNEEEHIGRLLLGISEQSFKNYEIIIVDSGSTDATLAITARFPVKIVSIPSQEFSFGRSLNLGCQEAKGEFIVIASAHVYPVYTNWLEKLLSPFQDPQVALVYGKQRGNETTKYTEHQIFEKWFPNTSNLRQSYPFCNNANAAIRKSLWEKLHYDEDLTGLEDLDWAKKVLALGYVVAYASDAEIIHVHNESYKKIFRRYYREALAYKTIFPKETFRFRDFAKLFINNAFADFYHAGQDQVFFKNFLSIAIFRFMQFWGTYKGFLQHGVVSDEVRQTFYFPRPIQKSTYEFSSPSLLDNKIDYDKLTTKNIYEKVV